jgi:hypothetical protein
VPFWQAARPEPADYDLPVLTARFQVFFGMMYLHE